MSAPGSAPRRFSFGGVPVYSPQSLSKEEAVAQFHARHGVYQNLLDILGEERPSHVLIIGTRGMGKTTLLQRVRYGVEDSTQLNSRYLALSFPEEQYNVNRLQHFLLNIVDALADAMEELGNHRMLARVEAYATKIGRFGREEIEEDVPKFLGEITQELQRGLLLLVDNADRLFETIEDREQWRMRELLSNRLDLTFFGATTQASEGLYGQDRAFFEFFKIIRLGPLNLEEVRSLLLRFSDAVEEKEGQEGSAKRRVEEWLAADAARLRTLVQLTGGNPRTTVLLFHLVLDGLAGGAREYLEQLLDQCTPNYKGRVDDLPPQVQQVLDALALRWDPATAMEIAATTGLETNVVSTYLTRLVRQGIAEKVDPGDSKKALYQVAERFFNIWYLMRASRRVRAKLRWFIEFLRVFFEPNDFGANDSMGPPVAAAILAACLGGSSATEEQVRAFIGSSGRPEFWRELLDLCENYAPFGKILLRLCDLVEEQGSSNEFVRLYRAVALAQLGEFPRAAVALEDALVGDPIELLSWAKKALEIFFAAAVRSGRVRDCIEVIEKIEWIDAWRPIYEALKSVEAGSGQYLKRVAVEIREPAQMILRQIAPELPGM